MSKITVESCLPGHPDKMCDQVADSLLDEYLTRDSNARVAIEVMGTGKTLLIGGEIKTKETLSEKEIIATAKLALDGIGNIEEYIVRVHQQSPEINKLSQSGAGDSGIMYGYAVDEANMMPSLITDVHKRARKYFEQYKGDGKVQLTQGNEIIEVAKIQGRDFEKGGFEADTGLTGRKLQVDTYCGLIPHGGGAFSGKDATKVDRSGAYMARWLAKHILYKYGLRSVTIGLVYEIGKAQPVMVSVERKGISYIVLRDYIKKIDLSPQAIIERFGLDQPIYSKTACYGHFGREEFPWEQNYKNL